MRKPGMRGLTLFLLFHSLLTSSCNRVKTDNIGNNPDKLTALIPNTATVYDEAPKGKMGFGYDLVKIFADHLELGVKLKVTASA